MANIIAGLGAQLGLDTTEFRKGISEAKEAVGELKEGVMKLIEITAFVELTKQAFEFSNQIVETAKANDVAVASVLELSRALEENGGRADETGRIYSGFTQKIESAAQGNGKAQESFARLGVTMKDLANLSEQDLFEKTISGLAKMKDSAERNGLAFMTLGKGIKGVDIRGLAETLEEGRGKMDKFAESISMAHELSLKLDAAAKDFTLNFTASVIPALSKFYDMVHSDSQIMNVFYEALRITSETVVILGERIYNTFRAVGMELSHTYENFKLLITGQFEEAKVQNLKYEEEVKAMAKRIADFEDSVLNPKEEHSEKAKEQQNAAREIISSIQKQLDKISQISVAYKTAAQSANLLLASQLNANEATKEEKQLQDELMKVVDLRNKSLGEIAKQMEAAQKAPKDKVKELTDALEVQRKKIEETFDLYIVRTRDAVVATQELQNSFWYGWDEAFKQYQENATRSADVGRQAFASVMSSMDSALTTFVKTGKLSFSSLAQSIIQDLIAIQLKAQATQLFSGLGLSAGSLGSFFSGLSSGSSSGSNYSLTSGQNTGGLGLKASAVGGPLGSGEASIVGENGPELFVPKGAGTVIPNSGNLSGANLGSSVVNNYNIHAIDTQSFEQRLYQSSGAIWAANQYASKNTSTTRSRV